MPEDMEARMVKVVVNQLGKVRVFRRLVATNEMPKAIYLSFTKKCGVGACMRFISSIVPCLLAGILHGCGWGVK